MLTMSDEITSENRAAWDATISTPKSVSLAALIGGNGRIRDAYRESVNEALKEFEKYLQARGGGPSSRHHNHSSECTSFEGATGEFWALKKGKDSTPDNHPKRSRCEDKNETKQRRRRAR